MGGGADLWLLPSRQGGRWSEEAADFFWIGTGQGMGAEMDTDACYSMCSVLVITTRGVAGGETPSLADVFSHDPRQDSFDGR